MKKILLIALPVAAFITACADEKPGKICIIQETTPTIFKVTDETPSDKTFVVVKYYDGKRDTMSVEKARAFVDEHPSIAHTDAAKTQGEGQTMRRGSNFGLSDILLYSFLFNTMSNSMASRYYPGQYNYYRSRPSFSRDMYRDERTYNQSMQHVSRSSAAGTVHSSSTGGGRISTKSGSGFRSPFNTGGGNAHPSSGGGRINRSSGSSFRRSGGFRRR